MSIFDPLLRRLALRGADADSIRQVAEGAREENEPARHLMHRSARKAALRAAIAGLPGGLLALPLGLLDTSSAMRARVELAGALHQLDDPAFLETAQWRQRTLETAYDLPAQRLSTRPLASRALVATVTERGLRAVGKRVASKLVPLAGSVVGGVGTYAWMLREGDRMWERVQGTADEAPDVGVAPSTSSETVRDKGTAVQPSAA